MRIVILAEFNKGKDWLWSYVKERIGSSIPIDQARTICLLGFLDSDEAEELLKNLLQHVPNTWVKELIKRSLDIWGENTWAKHWYRRFLSVEDNVLAWASFRLFLRCTDTRFWFWRESMHKEFDKSENYQVRNGFRKDNFKVIKEEIEANEKELREHFLGQKVKKGDIWPWVI